MEWWESRLAAPRGKKKAVCRANERAPDAHQLPTPALFGQAAVDSSAAGWALSRLAQPPVAQRRAWP